MNKIIGVTVGTPTSPAKMEQELKPVKTVNGAAPDENGNVEIAVGSGGTGADEVFIATYGKTTYAEIAEAVNAGKMCMCTGGSASSWMLPLTSFSSIIAHFSGTIASTAGGFQLLIEDYSVTPGGTWKESQFSEAESISGQTYNHLATEGAVFNYAQPKGNYLTEHQDISGKLDKNQGSANAGKTLVVGTNGNLTLTNMPEGGSGTSVTEVFVATYDETTYAEIEEAVNAGKICVCAGAGYGSQYLLLTLLSSTYARFSCTYTQQSGYAFNADGCAVSKNNNWSKQKVYTKNSIESDNRHVIATEGAVFNYAQPKGDYLTEVPDGYAKTEDIPTKPEDIGALPDTYTPPNQTAEQVGADPKGTATSAVSQHNTASDSHNDIRLELQAINNRLTAFFDSDDQTLDELSEIVAYITSNKTLIESITTSKVSVTDIINNLTTNVGNKPLSAAQGVVLKGLIDTLSGNLANYQPKGDYALASAVPTKVSQLTNDAGYITGYTETDPTVPAWAKQSTKPTYTAAEVGALPDTTKIPAVPTKVSEFTNDAGYLTEHQDISGKLDKNQGSANVGKILVVGTDGNLTLTDMPAGGGDVTGTIDENNNILLSGNLASGTYTLKYENEDGTYTEIGTLEVGEIGGYTNLFSTSGDGFANDTDFSGASSGRFLTNYIPCKDGDVIHIKGATLYKAKFHNSVTDEWGNALYAAALGVATSSYDDAVSVLTISSSTGVSNIDKMQIEVRSGNTALDSVIITVNQDIVD